MKTIKQYDFVILDFDGTICDLHVNWVELKKAVFNRFCSTYKWEKPLKLMEMVNAIYNENSDSIRSELLSLIKHYEMGNGCPVYSNVNNQLLNCVDDFYIISNNLHETINIALKQLNVREKCKGIIGIDDVKKSKPDINPFNLLCAITSCSKTESYIMIGDSETDERFAMSAQIDFKDVNDINYTNGK